MIIAFFGALCFGCFADPTFQPDAIRMKRDIEIKLDSPQNDVLSTANTNLPKCPYETEDLVGDQDVDVSYVPDWETVNSIGLETNGCWSPTSCNPRQKVAIIIPYKNREDHLKALLATLHPMLQRQRTAYCIFVSEQEDEGRFNKGAVMNAGFREVMKSSPFDCVIFHDVDMLPENDRNIYQCQDAPTHLSPLIDKFQYKPYGTDFGGVTMLKPAHYIAVNGMSNLFWGWGREDDDMQFRVERANFTVLKPINYEDGRYKMIPHQHPWIFRNFKLRDSTTDVRFLPPEYLVKYRERSTIEGVNSVDYKLASSTINPSYTHLKIELRRLQVIGVITKFLGGAVESEILDMTTGPCRYVKLDSTVICEEYGHTMVLKYLRKKQLTYEQAVEKCDELGYMCVGFVSDGNGRYTLREVTQLLSSDTPGPECNVKGDYIYHKVCPGDGAFTQVTKNIENPNINISGPELPFKHEITVNPIVKTKGEVIFRQALLYEGVQIGPIYSQSLGYVSEAKTIRINFSLPMTLPGYYTVVSKLTDELGQPLYEWKWSTKYTTANHEADAEIRGQNTIPEVFNHQGWQIQTYEDFIKTFKEVYRRRDQNL